MTKDSVLLEWNTSSDDGGCRIISYVIEYRDVDSLRWSRAAAVDAHTRSCTVQGLREGKEYLFRVCTVSDAGESEPLEVDFSVRPLRQAGKYRCWHKKVVKNYY